MDAIATTSEILSKCLTLSSSESIMGNSESYLTPEKIKQLEKSTHYNAKELELLYVRYTSNVNSANGAPGILLDDFLLMQDLCGCPIISQIAAAHADKVTGCIYPDDFIAMLSALSSKATAEEKHQLLFDSLDIYNEGYIEFDQLFSMYKNLMSPALPDSHITDVLVNILERKSLQEPGKITFEELKQLVSPSELQEKLTVNLQI